MKGLALETVIWLIIAIAGIIIFLSLLDYFKVVSNWFYCNVYWKVRSFFLKDEVAIPEICLQYVETRVRIEEVDERDNKLFSRKLLAHIIACWKEAEIKGLFKSHPCYELHLLKKVENVTEANVTDVLIKEDRCTSIENSDYGCGAKDQIIWNVAGNAINNQTIILIEYNGTTDAIEVIG